MRTSDPKTRSKLEKRLGRPLSNEAWGLLCKEHWVDEYECGEITFGYLVDRVRMYFRVFGRTGGSGKVRTDSERVERTRLSPRLRQRADSTSRAFAAIAAEDPDITRFRQNHLGGNTLRREQVDGWVGATRKADRAAAGRRGANGPAPRDRTEVVLTFTVATPRALFVPAAGILAELAQLGEALSDRYSWRQEIAVGYVLTGLGSPRVSPISVTRRHYDCPGPAQRIELQIEPGVTPEELAQYWQAIRRTISSTPFRPQSEKHETLAAFSLGQPEELSWAELQTRWNRKHPGWAYSQVSNFRRDVPRAIERLLQSYRS